MESTQHELLKEQAAYYRARATEYDEWFLRRGRYDRGPEWNQQWFAEVEALKHALRAFQPGGSVLELACGTGWWTEELLCYADHVTAMDASAEVLSLNRARTGGDPRVEYVQADIFEWVPDGKYDVVFFSFWLSHIPSELFGSFWQSVGAALKPQGQAIFIDSLRSELSTAADHQLPCPDETLSVRRLNDGREFRVVKIFYEPEDLQSKLGFGGWHAKVQRTPHFFIYGSAQRN